MFQNKLVNVMLIILIALTLIGVVTLVLINHFSNSETTNKEPTIDEIIANSWETEEITTNISGNGFARTRFLFHVDSKQARDEIEKRDFQVQNLIIRELSYRSESDLGGEHAIEELESRLQTKVNELLQEGRVIDVYTTEIMIQ